MCFICDGGSYEELIIKMSDDIEERGWHLVAVDSDPPSGTGWAYTVGLIESFGHPEIIITGMCCAQCAGRTLNAIGDMIADGEELDVGDDILCDCGCGRTMARVGPVHDRHWEADRFNFWHNYYEGRPDEPLRLALQAIIVDTRGRGQDDRRNRRWPLDRLDRAPHISAKSRRLLR